MQRPFAHDSSDSNFIPFNVTLDEEDEEEEDEDLINPALFI
jgi:hypothetical protein